MRAVEQLVVEALLQTARHQARDDENADSRDDRDDHQEWPRHPHVDAGIDGM